MKGTIEPGPLRTVLSEWFEITLENPKPVNWNLELTDEGNLRWSSDSSVFIRSFQFHPSPADLRLAKECAGQGVTSVAEALTWQRETIERLERANHPDNSDR